MSSVSPTARTSSGSIRLFRVAGIDVDLHWSWAVVAMIELQTRDNVYTSQLWNVLEYLTLFGIVLLHELGHALACRSVGGRADRILLWPLGGVAFVEPPPRPGAVLWSIAAGPLVNVVLLAMTFVPVFVLGVSTTPDAAADAYRFVFAVITINVALLVFNLLPIYPLDGGQILRALLWFAIGPARSLTVASGIGFVGAAAVLAFAVRERDVWLSLLAVLGAWQSIRGLQTAWRHADILHQMPRMHAVLAAFHAGDYEAGLQKAEQLEDGAVKTAQYFFMHASMLHQLGRFAEAEAGLREALPLEEDPRRKALVYHTLALVLMDQERFSEAIASFEDAARAWPDRGANHCGIAQAWLRQGREHAQALEHARRGVAIDRHASGLPKDVLDIRVGEDLGVLAWAVAAHVGDVREVKSLLEEAFSLCGSRTRSTVAELHYHAGRAYAALRMPEQSGEHLRLAIESDPQGSRFGQLARLMQS